MSPQAARKYLKDNKVKYILAQFVDIHGAAKAKAVPVEHLDMMLNEGAGFAGFALWGFGMGPHGPDYMAVGDPSTLSVVNNHEYQNQPRSCLSARLMKNM